MTTRLDVLSPRPKRDDTTYWHRVGTAWQTDKGVNITFDSLPLPDKDGRVSVILREPLQRDTDRNAHANREADRSFERSQGGGSLAEDLSDDIPFGPEWR